MPGPPVSCARDQSMATWAALSKILPLPSASALALAPLKTFSNTRGTASTKVGWNSPRSSTRFFTSGVCPMTVRVLTAPTWMTRASTCASGMNSSSEPSTLRNRPSSDIPLPISNRKLPCVSSQPLGRPVVPLV